MKNAIPFYYNLNPENLISTSSVTSFYINYDKFYLCKLVRPETDLDEIINITKISKTPYHTIIPNNQGRYYTEIEKEKYILLKINSPENEEVELTEIIKFQLPFNNKTILNRTNWSTLWSEKIDYLEYQISELAIEHPIIKSSFSYYVGLAENAIAYFNMLNIENEPTFIAHKRIEYPALLKDILNPLDIVVDYKVRDVASYLKAKFFKSNTTIDDIRQLVNYNYLSPLEYNLLFARLLYPSYYFDTLYRVLEKGLDEESLLTYINKVDDYEKFLNEIYREFSRASSMIKVDWLIKS